MQFAANSQFEILIFVCGALILLAALATPSARQSVIKSAVCVLVVAAVWLTGLWRGEFFTGVLAEPQAQGRWIVSALALGALIAYLLGLLRPVLSLGLPVFLLFQLSSLIRACDPAAPPWLLMSAAGIALAATAIMPHFFRDDRKIGGGRFLLIAVWCALVASLAESGVRYARLELFGPMKVIGDDRFAMLPEPAHLLAPLGNLTALVCLAAVIVMPAFLSKRPLPLGSLFILLAATWMTLIVRAAPTLDPVATFVMASGFAVATLWLVRIGPWRFQRIALWSIPCLVLALAGLAIYGKTRQLLAKRPADEAVLDVERSAPNVVLIVLDTVRAQNLSLYGYSRSTSPRLGEFGSHSVVFDNAIAPCSWTLPTHATLFTGRMPHEHLAIAMAPLDDRFPTLAEKLGAVGYDTAGFVANWVYCGAHTGLARGFAHYDDHDRWVEETICTTVLFSRLLTGFLPSIRKTAEDVNSEFLGWLDHGQSKPFFAFLNYYDAHDPYFVPDPRFDRFRTRAKSDALPASEAARTQAMIDTYDGAIGYLDHQIGLLLDELGHRGILENTCVIITSDHGENFGEQGEFGHGFSLYRQQIGVPLLIHYPGAGAHSKRIAPAVNLLDIGATVFDLVHSPGASEFPGTSLARFWREPASGSLPEGVVLSELLNVVSFSPELMRTGPVFSLLADDLHYIRYQGVNREQVFDARRDPRDLKDLAQSERGREALLKFRKVLEGVVPRIVVQSEETASIPHPHLHRAQ